LDVLSHCIESITPEEKRRLLKLIIDPEEVLSFFSISFGDGDVRSTSLHSHFPIDSIHSLLELITDSATASEILLNNTDLDIELQLLLAEKLDEKQAKNALAVLPHLLKQKSIPANLHDKIRSKIVQYFFLPLKKNRTSHSLHHIEDKYTLRDADDRCFFVCFKEGNQEYGFELCVRKTP